MKMILFFFSFPDVTLYVVVKDGYILNTEKSRSDFMCSQIALTSIWFREATTSKVHSEFVKGFLSLRFVDVSGAEGIQLQNDHTPVSFTKTRLVAHKKALGEVCHSRSQGSIQGEPFEIKLSLPWRWAMWVGRWRGRRPCGESDTMLWA